MIFILKRFERRRREFGEILVHNHINIIKRSDPKAQAHLSLLLKHSTEKREP